jgi:hypothetical protein
VDASDDPDADRWSVNPALCQAVARDCRSAAGRDSLWAKAVWACRDVLRDALELRREQRPPDEQQRPVHPPGRQVAPLRELSAVSRAQRDGSVLLRA